MSAKTREHIYNAICIFCIVICIILIGRVAADELTEGRGEAHIHCPPEIEGNNDKEEKIISEKYISSELQKYLKEVIPINNINVNMSGDGRMKLSAEVSKNKLIDFLKSYGMGSGIAVVTLPEVIELEISIKCRCDEETGLVAIEPEKLSIEGIAFDLAALPAESLSAVNGAINRMLMATGHRFGKIEFTEDGIILD